MLTLIKRQVAAGATKNRAPVRFWQRVPFTMQNTPNKRAHDSDRADNMIAAAQAQTLWGLFRKRVRRSPDAAAYRDYNHAQGRWVDHSWAIVGKRVDRFRAALAKENMKPGDRIAVLLPNGVDWACLDLAAADRGWSSLGFTRMILLPAMPISLAIPAPVWFFSILPRLEIPVAVTLQLSSA